MSVSTHPSGRGGRFVRRIAGKIAGAEVVSGDIWDAIQLARHQDRPYPLDYIARLMPDFEEIHGDRAAGDDPAIVAGIGRYHGAPLAIIGQQKGRDAQDRAYRNFGMPSPEGYRKGMRLMELCDRLQIPLVTLIDTPGAFPGAQAEEHGQGGAIARSMMMMLRLSVRPWQWSLGRVHRAAHWRWVLPIASSCSKTRPTR